MGRGAGKTRSAAEFIKARVADGKARNIFIGAPTHSDLIKYIIRGPSGIMAVYPEGEKPKFNKADMILEWSNGATANLITAEKPDRIRGGNYDTYWADELASWRYPDAFTQLVLAFRAGDDTRGVISTTPRPTDIIKSLVARVGKDVVITKASTYANRAFLSADYIAEIEAQYGGTNLGRQEIFADILDDSEGALWKRTQIEALRAKAAPEFTRVVVAVDPAVAKIQKSTDSKGAETGIVVVGLGVDGHGYVLDDRSGRYSPNDWAQKVVSLYQSHKADRIVAEANQGGALVEANIMTADPNVPVKLVNASRGKQTRAEPIAALYEQHRVHHVGCIPQLEDQMCSWVPTISESPDRVDALVWGLTELMLTGARAPKSPTHFEPFESVFDNESGW